MNRCNKAIFVSTDIEDGFVVHLISVRESSAKLGKAVEIGFFDNPIPMPKCGPGIGMLCHKFIEALPGNNMHNKSEIIQLREKINLQKSSRPDDSVYCLIHTFMRANVFTGQEPYKDL